jgi:hypothetical protein
LKGEYKEVSAKGWVKQNIRKATSETTQTSQEVSKKYKIELEEETDISDRIHVRIFRKECK